MISSYLFALFMGLVTILFVYLDSVQTGKKYSKIIYIKCFIFSSIVSLLTSLFYGNMSFYQNNITSDGIKIIGKSGFNETPINSLLYKNAPSQNILTGTPDF